MQNYFYIQPITINISPFETATANAVRWVVSGLPRGTSTAECVCTFMDVTGEGISDLYFWNLSIPKDILDQWLDDSVIDDYIILTSNGIIVKDPNSTNRPII